MSEVIHVRSEQFWPGEKVITLVQHEYFPSGTQGTIASRWLGTIYAVRLPNGNFHWMDSSELSSINPNRHNIAVGDIAEVSSDRHKHKFVKLGDLVQVVKVMEDADYYGVMINNELHWLTGFELAELI